MLDICIKNIRLLLITAIIIAGSVWGICTPASASSMPEDVRNEGIILDTPVTEADIDADADTKKVSITISYDYVDGADGYVILRSTGKDSAGKKIGETEDMEYTDKTVKRGRTYYYSVYAYNDSTDNLIRSEFSKKLCCTVPEKPPVVKADKVTYSSCTLKWKNIKRVLWYSIYRKEKGGEYKCIKNKVKTNDYTDKKLKEKTGYTYKILAVCASAQKIKYMTGFSEKVKIKTPKKAFKIAYVGDSILSQLGEYRLITDKNRKMICKIGISPSTFYNNVLMDNLLDYNPDRMYIMLGANSLEGNPTEGQYNMVFKFYKLIIKECLKQNHDMQVVVLPICPVRPGASLKNSVVAHFNGMLKSYAEDKKMYYYDYIAGMTESDGSLIREYAEGDRIHWKITGCKKFKELLDKYEKETF